MLLNDPKSSVFSGPSGKVWLMPPVVADDYSNLYIFMHDHCFSGPLIKPAQAVVRVSDAYFAGEVRILSCFCFETGLFALSETGKK